MPSFDYIESKDLRESLESDYGELARCTDICAWKGVQVLAGSIVEALLIDYLAATSHESRTNKDPLKMDLSEAIEICKAELVLSPRASDLCSVVRSYRNLIHPGRMVRLGEQPPDKSSAMIAVSLVDMINDEVAKKRRAAVGLTAEQLLSKILRDANSLSLLKHLLVEVPEIQRRRLLIELIPAQYFQAVTDDFDTSQDRLTEAYRQILESTTTETKHLVAAEFVEVLRGADGHEVVSYSEAFFRASDLQFVSPQHFNMVKDHVFARVPKLHTMRSIELLRGGEPFWLKADAIKWLDPIIRTLMAKTVNAGVRLNLRRYAVGAVTATTAEFDTGLQKRLNEWITHFERNNMAENLQMVTSLKSEIDASLIPF